jgi:HK97 family phage major capsid protein
MDDISVGKDFDSAEVRHGALDAIEASKRLEDHQAARLEKMVVTGEGVDSADNLARHIVATATPEYRTAWAKILARRENSVVHTVPERHALGRYLEARAATEGTNSAGGYGVPFDIDSAIIGTSGGLAAPVLDHCKMAVQTSGDAWHGVSSALAGGYAWAAEDGTFTDSSLTIAQPTLTIYKAAAVSEVSYELFEDYGGDGFQAEMGKIFAQEFLTFMGNQTLNGTGTGQPNGIFTQLFNTTTNPAHTVATTLGSVGLVDVQNAWKALPDRFRYNAHWIMHPTVLNKIADEVSSGGSMTEFRYNDQGVPLLRGRPVIETQYAPTYVNTTATSQEFLTLVDLADGFLFVNRVPTIVEVAPNAFAMASTGMPTMQRFLIHAPRVAFGLLDPLFGVILANS